jgi:alanyl-tRNA synthetase
MKRMGLNEIRESYLAFFESKGHLRMHSFSLIPRKDPSVLLINAGMTPLKPYFTGDRTPPAPRVATCQKCIRTPDIERVGKTPRHGTFFEMLGNFSFGDYFKEEAIVWAWEFCTKILEMPYEKLFVTVYEEDDEAYDIWHRIVGLPKEKITRLGKEDNFWEHGTGPCGPCSEIHYDRGEDQGCKSSHCVPGCDCDRYMEFWNLVFTQFNREENGTYTPLKKKNIDTGGGLERFACILQGVDNLFEVDTVRSILDHVCRVTKVKYGQDHDTDMAIRVITDHIRSTVMMIGDGIMPDNTGRGYVLKRLLRRAARFGRILGRQEPFLYETASLVIGEFAQAYPELVKKESLIRSVVLKEEEGFARTVTQGLNILTDSIRSLKEEGKEILPGEMVFRLHDTFGFPMDLTREIASESGFQIDETGFLLAMNAQRKTARAFAVKNKSTNAWGGADVPEEIKSLSEGTLFTGYDEMESTSSVLYLIRVEDRQILCNSAKAGDDIVFITEQTPFYAQSGGQSADIGLASGEGFTIAVTGALKTAAGVVLHQGRITHGKIHTGDEIRLSVDRKERMATARNHTATHLLQKALRDILGEHVVQAGSDVNPKRLRFDFSHFSAMTREEKHLVEQEVNREILADKAVVTEIMTAEQAQESGAMALFDDKYAKNVRVVSVGDYSKELCGGTHLATSAQVCLFKIVSESAVAAGIRRIEAVTGGEAFNRIRETEQILEEASAQIKANPSELPKRISQLIERTKFLEKELENKTLEIARSGAGKYLDQTIERGNLKLLFAVVETANVEELRSLGDQICEMMKEGVLVLGSVHGEKVSLFAMATAKAVSQGAHAGNIIREAAKIAGGGGGGRPDMAQAGGKDPHALDEALKKAKEICMEQLTSS